MTRIGWWAVDIVCQMLEPDEREAVRGDFAESGQTPAQGLRDSLGLVARRQAALWKHWRPWLVLVGLVAPFGIVLSLVCGRVAHISAVYVWMYANNWTWTYLTNPGARHDLVHYSASFGMECLALICWSWTVGFALRRVSRRTIAANGGFFCLVLLLGELSGTPRNHDTVNANAAVFSLLFYSVVYPLILRTLLVLLPSLLGMRFKENNT